MKDQFKKVLAIIVLLLIAAVTIFIEVKNQRIVLEDLAIVHETKFGGVYIKIDIDDFNNLGFEYGDSVNLSFSNGYELNDLPYYNGYYTDADEPLLIAYPGYDYIKAGINYGDDLWIVANLEESDKATIKLNKHGKYLRIQEARDIHYTDDQGELSDVVFANFRNVAVGDIKTGVLYRSASPDDNSHKRAAITDKLVKDAGVNFIVNLSDSDVDIEKHIQEEGFDSPYFLSLYNDKKVIALSMSMNFKDVNFNSNLVKGLSAIASHPGPYLIHCVEGKDRTGFVILIIEALLGASYDEMVSDYMETYKNYYGITGDSDSERYKTIKEKNIDLMLHTLIGDKDMKEDLSAINDYSPRIRSYLVSIGLSEETIDSLIYNLSN